MFLSRQVNQFIAAVQEGSFLKASEKISITPSAMSRGIGELEHKIGDRLIKRTRNGVQTTEKGEWLYQKILPHYNCIKKLTDELKIHCKRREIIIQNDGVYLPMMKNKILRLLQEHSNLKLIFMSEKYDSPDRVLCDDMVDIYISASLDERVLQQKNISSISMKSECMGLVTSQNKLNNDTSIKNILSNTNVFQTHSTISSPLFNTLKTKLLDDGCQLNLQIVNDISEVIYLINNGAGVSFMPRYDYDDIDIGKNLIYIEKPFESIVSFQRNIYFKTDRFSELMDICSILSE